MMIQNLENINLKKNNQNEIELPIVFITHHENSSSLWFDFNTSPLYWIKINDLSIYFSIEIVVRMTI